MKCHAISVLLAFILFSAGSASALTVADVSSDGLGAPDNLFYAEKLKSSSKQSELNFISAGLATINITFNPEEHGLLRWNFAMAGDDEYLPGMDYDNFWINLDDAPSLWAFDFQQRTPSYFLIKTGRTTYDGEHVDHFLFENLGSLRYGVVDLSVFGPDGIGLNKISHVSIPAPEPSTFLLLGTGLAGLVYVVRRRKKN